MGKRHKKTVRFLLFNNENAQVLLKGFVDRYIDVCKGCRLPILQVSV